MVDPNSSDNSNSADESIDVQLAAEIVCFIRDECGRRPIRQMLSNQEVDGLGPHAKSWLQDSIDILTPPRVAQIAGIDLENIDLASETTQADFQQFNQADETQTEEEDRWFEIPPQTRRMLLRPKEQPEGSRYSIGFQQRFIELTKFTGDFNHSGRFSFDPSRGRGTPNHYWTLTDEEKRDYYWRAPQEYLQYLLRGGTVSEAQLRNRGFQQSDWDPDDGDIFDSDIF